MLLIRKVLIFFLLLLSLQSKAQMDYPIFTYRTNIEPADSQQLSFHLYNLNYLHNTEWFGNIPLSGTRFGYQLIPEIRYQISPRLMLSGGLYLQKEFGRKGYTSLAPTFSMKYKARHSSYIIGTLEGNMDHGFIEPIYSYRLLLDERLENGFQILIHNRFYEHDLYLNWRRAIHLGDKFKEEFDIGYSARFHILDRKNFKLDVPLQLIYSHKGGQIDSLDIPLTSLTNWASGLELTLPLKGKLLKKIEFNNYYVDYKDISGTKVQAFDKGSGFLSRLFFDFQPFALDLRYWYGSKYIGPRGMALFQSVSEKYPGLVEPTREILIASLIFNKEIYKNVFFDLRFIPYKDFREKMTSGTGLEFSYEMYLKYVLDLNITKLRSTGRR